MTTVIQDNIEVAGESHVTHAAKLASTESDMDVVVLTQKNPYFEFNFIGTYVAICLGTMSSYGGFVMPATSLALINETIAVSIGFTLVGRLSDIFGRRWFMIGCSSLALIGCIVGATAQNVNTLIGGTVLIGLAAAGQLSSNYIIGELVPVEHRGFALSFIFLSGVPFAGFGPYISRLFIANTKAGFRWDYYVSIIVNGLALMLFVICYHPPKFDALHRHRTRWQEIKDMDFMGIFLFTAGLLLLLMGLSWGGSLYPWKSAHVISTIIVGFVLCVLFVLWECYAGLRRPLLPMHLFKSRDYCVLVTITTVGGMLYYSLNVLFSTEVGVLFTTDIVYAGLLSCAIGGGVALGQTIGGIILTPGGNQRWKLFASTIGTTALTVALAGGTQRETAAALATCAAICIGVLESLAVVGVTIVIEDPSEMGAGAGAFGSIRSVGGVLATTIFTTILTNKVSSNTESIVIPALLKAGLPLTSLKPFLTALASGNSGAITAVPGVTESIIGIAVAQTKVAYQKAFTVVYLSSLPFGVISIIAAFWAPNIKDLMTHDVVRRLDHGQSTLAGLKEGEHIESKEAVQPTH
ncbi:hypothetical protein LTR10_023057 [Elasticomyces elasticus]|uniref:Major facilitator superfamily (MFS) profile domain-containing protein n=1 Tax=Exophiala sideris TaxID=1016849 RepID=A0ABR0IUJ8_9EURO|nr:hypothetical protein LTR10_023057 [Elasticomyces elasticus]KAK5021020.1 hypothetical protein LTS07_011275 [Exophiala sideris]KAK5023339.1 hypothetical protein LTR13_011251 [Exophiala sideris]KAK5048746.1 hypothetical protein LTR69_011292 [Exophiala sideris]KAK5176189.1 hypothetical protein LTR44_011284 [Eurotiomycetes sp. CCFEE 6388]